MHPANFRTLVSVFSKITEHYFAGQIRCTPIFSPFLIGVVICVLFSVEQVEHPISAMHNIHIIFDGGDRR